MAPAKQAALPEPDAPPPDCGLCPRLVDFRRDNRRSFPDFHNAPVASFGPLDARLLIVGLAPGLKGANRTGRPFTGDFAGDLLYETLCRFGLAVGRYDRHADDGLRLVDCRITNAIRCVPPANKPLGEEINACRPFLQQELRRLPRLTTVLALGRIAHEQILLASGLRRTAFAFSHGGWHRLPDGPVLADSYHCSRYNTNTGRLTERMFHDVMARIVRHLR